MNMWNRIGPNLKRSLDYYNASMVFTSRDFPPIPFIGITMQRHIHEATHGEEPNNNFYNNRRIRIIYSLHYKSVNPQQSIYNIRKTMAYIFTHRMNAMRVPATASPWTCQ
jgi:hypothetical protein